MGKRIALIFGNGSYAKLGKLRNPANDARDVGESLKKLGFDVEIVADGNLGDMMDAVERFGRRLTGAEAGLFFYAGHGVQANGVNYLIPIDADVQGEYQLKYRTLPADFILETMNASGCSLNIIILDACRDNPFSTLRSATRGLAVVGSAPAGAIIVYATDPGKTAADGTGNNGVFTEALLRHMSTPGLDVKELFDKVGSDVATATRQQQTPWVSSKYYGTYYLAGLASPPKPTPALPPITSQSQSASNAIPFAERSQGKAELIVRTIPEDADILVGGTNVGTAGDVLTIPAGAEIDIKARKGFLVGSAKILPVSGQLYELDIKLEQQKGNLLVKASGAETGTMYLDGKEIGSFGKGLFRDLPAGDHEYTVRGKGFYAAGKVSIVPDVTTTVPAALLEVGSLRLSMPDPCEVNVSAKGYGPVTLGGSKRLLDDLPVGELSVSARGPGYDDIDATLIVKKGAETLWTPWTTGSLTISTLPAGADIWVNGKLAGKSPQTIHDLLPGKVTVTARAEGYEDGTLTAIVALGKTSSASANLARSVGSLKPLVGEDVSIVVEGAEIDRRESSGPHALQNLPTGQYKVEAKGPGYESASGTVMVRRNEETTWRPWTIGKLLVESEPVGAKVLVRGKEAGVTPLVCQGLDAGSSVPLTVRAEGYEDAVFSQEVVGGKTLRVPIKLARSVGTLSLKLPPDGEVVVRSAEIGERKLTGPSSISLPIGTYSVEAGGPGYETAVATVTVKRNTEATWQPWTTGKLLVESEPTGALVLVRGKDAGMTPLVCEGLEAGSSVPLTVRAEGYEDTTLNQEVVGGKTLRIPVKLARSVGRLKVAAPNGTVVRYSGIAEGSLTVANSGSAVVSLPIGDYAVMAERKEFDPDSSTIKISRGSETAWAPWSTGALRIESRPSGADILVDGSSVGQAPKTISPLPFKTVAVVVKTPGYEDRQLQTTVVRGHTNTIYITLARSLGLLRVIAPSDATISVKNPEISERKATGDGAFFDLPTGEYQIEATRPGSQPVVSSIVIERNGDHEWIPWTKSYLSLTSNPPGAMVLVDGAEQGVTPVLLELEAKNTHRIQLNLAKYESYSSEINLPIGKNTEVSQELRGLPGSISVATMPLGANVTLDGVDLEWKETPCVFENVNSGVHKLDVFQLAKDNKYYAGATYTVNVGPAENVVVNKQLTRDEIILNILDALPGSNLYIDGNSVQDPKVFSDGISMLAGLYEVLLKGPEGQEWSAVASVVTGSCNLNPRGMQYLLPQKTIAIDGKLDDWTSIGPVLFASNNLDPLPKNTGTKISKGYLCRDEKNLYWRMDLADGKPDTKLWNQVHELSLSTGSNAISLSVRNIWGKLVAFIGTNQKAPDEGFYAGSYSLTPSGLEMSFPISSFKKYLKSDFGIVSMRTYVNHGADLMASWQTQDETTSQHIRLAF